MIDITSILFTALTSEYGVVVRSNNREKATQYFRNVIAKDGTFRPIGVVVKQDGEIWLVRKDRLQPVEDEPPAPELPPLELADNELGLEVDDGKEI